MHRRACWPGRSVPYDSAVGRRCWVWGVASTLWLRPLIGGLDVRGLCVPAAGQTAAYVLASGRFPKAFGVIAGTADGLRHNG